MDSPVTVTADLSELEEGGVEEREERVVVIRERGVPLYVEINGVLYRLS